MGVPANRGSTLGRIMDTPGEDRRNFVASALYGLWALIGATLGALASAYLLLPPRTRSEQAWIDVADVEDLPAGEPTEVVFRRNRIDGWKVTSEKTTAWVVRKGSEEVAAFMPQCTHLGCAYHWDRENEEFLCPCHTSTFNLEGEVLTGPAPRPLDRYGVRVESHRLMLGPSQKPEPGQPQGAS